MNRIQVVYLLERLEETLVISIRGVIVWKAMNPSLQKRRLLRKR